MSESRLQDDQFDPEMIHDIFTQAIQDLKVFFSYSLIGFMWIYSILALVCETRFV